MSRDLVGREREPARRSVEAPGPAGAIGEPALSRQMSGQPGAPGAMPRFLLARGTPAAVASLAEGAAAGAAVPASLREPLEARFGASLAPARLHQGPKVTAGLQALGAPAAALGRHVFLSGTAPAALMPGMVRHELAHVAQARRAEPDAGRPLRLGARGSSLEGQAARAAAGGMVGAPLSSDPNTLHRYDPDPGPGDPQPPAATPEATLDTRLFLLEELILDAEEDDPEEAARLERELLLAQFTHPEPFHSVEGEEEFIRACELDSEKEEDTLRKLGGEGDWILRQYPQAFPAWWANEVKQRLGIDVDPAALKATVDAAWSMLESLAGYLPEYMAKFGLPVAFREAQNLRKFELSLDHAKQSGHMVGAFAQAALRYRATAFRSGFAHWWPLFVNNLVENIKSGEVVVDPDEIDRLTGAANKLGGFVRMGGTPAEDEFRMLDSELINLRQTGIVVALVAFGSSIQTGAVLWRQAAALFQAKLAEADALIEDASFLDNIGRGFMWATELDYFAGSAALIAAAISENIWEIVQTVLLIAGAQAIPVVNILVDLYLLFTVGTDLVSAIIDLGGAFRQAGQSDTMVEMQRASARLAVALLQDTMRIVLDFLGIKGTVAMLERRVARIHAENPSISQRDAVRQAVKEKHMAEAGTSPPATPPTAAPPPASPPAGGGPGKVAKGPEPAAKQAPGEAVSAAPTRIGGATTSTFVTYSHKEMLELFIKMFKKPGPPQDAYHVYATVEAYQQAWLRLPGANPQASIPPGFFLPSSRIIHLPPNAGTLTVFHEALHWASQNAGFGQRMGQFVNEGMTEWLTQQAFGSQAYRINYGQNVAFVKLLGRQVGDKTLTSAFLDSNWQPMYSALERRLGSSDLAERFVDLLRRTPVEGGENVGRAMDLLMR